MSQGAPQVLFAARRKWLDPKWRQRLQHLPPPGHTFFMRIPVLENPPVREGLPVPVWQKWEEDAIRLWNSSILAEIQEQIPRRAALEPHLDANDFSWEKLVEQPNSMGEWHTWKNRKRTERTDDNQNNSKKPKTDRP